MITWSYDTESVGIIVHLLGADDVTRTVTGTSGKMYVLSIPLTVINIIVCLNGSSQSKWHVYAAMLHVFLINLNMIAFAPAESCK